MWQRITYETCTWDRNPDEFATIPKSRRRKIAATYEAAVPATIANLPVEISPDLAQRAVEVCLSITRFDQAQAAGDYDFPALLLRSESSSSSQIERLTSSARYVALAALTDKAPANAQLIAANVSAMHTALSQTGPIGIPLICSIHDVLMASTGERLGLREEQVWIGGTAYSPHGALFVPPRATHVPSCLEDLTAFAKREDVNPVIKAAIFHAQFETIHPFTDGNGRTGRALIHKMLLQDEVALHTSLPVSAGLLHDVEPYMKALDSYHEGEVEPIIECVVDALELAVVIGSRVARSVNAVLEKWGSLTTERKGSAAHRLPNLLVKQPVVSTAYVAKELEITERAARNLIGKACERGILSKMGNAKRGAFYQADDLISILEEASNIQGIRRIAAS